MPVQEDTTLTTTGAPAPNQIQLEVQVEQNQPQYEIQQPEPIPMPSPSEEEEEEEPDDDEPEPPCNALPYCAFFAVLFFFLGPVILSALNYWTDYNLWVFMKSTRDDFIDSRESILNLEQNITTAICKFPDTENSLSDFEQFLKINTTQKESKCICSTYSGSDTGGIPCDTLNNDQLSTNNFDYDLCITNQVDSTSYCYVCECDQKSWFSKHSPQQLYSEYLYNELESDEDKEMYCHPERTRDTVDADGFDAMEGRLQSCAIACIVFFAISGIWLSCRWCVGCKVRYRDLKRSYMWCFKGKKPKKREKYHPDNTINKDEFTIFVICTIFLHIFEDVIQSIIGIMFSIYKQGNGGVDCVIDWSNTQYTTSIELVPYTGGLNIVQIMGRDPPVELFFIFSFLAIFLTGLTAIRLLGFDLQKVLIYSWWRNIAYSICAVFLGLFFILLVLSPFWGATWIRRDDLYLSQGEARFLGFTALVGVCGYCVAAVMPCLFADQLDCACECDGGCCGG